LPLLIVVLGPTGSGKTVLSLALAQRFGGEIVNCDSVALYREFEIGTAKPSAEERARVPHHLFDVADPTAQVTAGEYAQQARQILREISGRHKLPIVVGGGGEKRTLRIVARYADACNVGGGLENVKRKDEVLRQHCAEVGRDPAEIERTAGVGVCVIRDDPAEAERVMKRIFEHNGSAQPWSNQLIGTPEQVADQLRPYLGIGFRHFTVGFPAPYDEESMERLVREVKPMLESA